jgi:hypothetical protein
MLLVALLDGERVDATKHSTESWSALKESKDRERLVMPLCGIRAIPKSRGSHTRFFAHHSVAECNLEHGGETKQHLAMKEALAGCVDAVPGWHAVVEFAHPSREWIVDVLAESDDRRQRVAFEVQLSSQSPENYFRRTDRYFQSGIFPVWLVPRRLEYHPIEVPVMVTGFGKSSEIPADVSGLLALETSQDFVRSAGDNATLGEAVTALLRHGHQWKGGSPEYQVEMRRQAEARERAELDVAAKRLADLEEAVKEMNLRFASPEIAFGRQCVESDSQAFVWGALTGCWNCEEPMLVWDARSPSPGKRWARVPALQVKNPVGPTRYENHPDVHRIVDRWAKAAQADIPKARIELRASKTKGGRYSAFVCPACDSLMGQFFVSRIRDEHWSLIGGPVIVEEVATPKEPAPRRRKQEPPKTAVYIAPIANSSPRVLAPKQTWAELHSEEGIAEARRKFLGTAAKSH